jgi:hypothetical protein
VRPRPPRSARVIVRARTGRSRVAWGLGLRIRSEGRVFRCEKGCGGRYLMWERAREAENWVPELVSGAGGVCSPPF